jgi:N-acetylmuramoyl-L-alanine amidase
MDRARYGLVAITILGVISLTSVAVAQAHTYTGAAPSGPDTLVLPRSETTAIGGVNWTSPRATASPTLWPTCSSSSSAMSKPTAIVLHETGYMKPAYGPHPSNKCVHFLITRSGTIIQLAPLDRAWVTSPSGNHSINIEMANGDDAGLNFSFSAGANRIKVDWMGSPYLYWPTDPQLEATWLLVDLLTSQDFDGDGKSDIPRIVANADLVPAFFFFSAQGQTVSPSVDAKLTSSWEGIMSHSINGAGEKRNDGGVAAAYVHFRLGGASHETALCLTQRLATSSREKSLSTPLTDLGITAKAFGYHTWVPLTLNEADESCTSYKSMDVPTEVPVIDLGGDDDPAVPTPAPGEVIDLGGDDQ